RERIEKAATKEERLRVIKEIRERQWLERLPEANLIQVRSAPGEKRPQLIQELRQEEKKRTEKWQEAGKHWNDRWVWLHGYDDKSFQETIQKDLMPKLSPEEKERLKNAEGHAEFPQVVWELINTKQIPPGTSLGWRQLRNQVDRLRANQPLVP